MVYFFLAPLFLNQGTRLPLGLVFGAGFLVSLPIVFLFLSSCLASFSHRIHFGKLTGLVMGLMAIFFFSVAWNTPGNLFDFNKVFFWYVKFLAPATCFLIMVRIWKVEDLSRLYTLLFVLGVISLVLLPTQIFFDLPPVADEGRFASFFRDSNGYVLLLDVLFSFTLPTLINRFIHRRKLTGYLLLNMAILVAVGLTGSRGGFMITTLVFAVNVLATRAWRVILGLGLMAIPFLGLFGYVFLSRYNSGLSSASVSDMGRLWSYFVALGMIAHHPLIGVGFGNILDAFGSYGQIYAFALGRPLEIHNAFLEIFAESGFIAFLLFSILLGVPAVRLAKRVIKGPKEFYPLADLAGLNVVIVFVIYSFFYPEYLGHDDFWVYYSVVITILRARITDPDFEFKLFPSVR